MWSCGNYKLRDSYTHGRVLVNWTHITILKQQVHQFVRETSNHYINNASVNERCTKGGNKDEGIMWRERILGKLFVFI
jgi:hypothetical protein